MSDASPPQRPESSSQPYVWPEPWWRRPKVWAVAGAIGVVVAAGTAWGTRSGGGPSTFTMRGAVSLRWADSTALITTAGPGCTGGGAGGIYSSVRERIAVEVDNPSGGEVAMGKLGAGHPDSVNSPTACRFPFVVPKVPAGLRSYSFRFAIFGKGPYPRTVLKDGFLLGLG